ncbi:MAG: hypothetical protein IPI81_11850 [Flavobacteriales bacterium]|nr:hypothetical protein [Flavobacteriales bacterium]MCC6939096.1 hypothetical protein [Flavobacteriales bacterium]
MKLVVTLDGGSIDISGLGPEDREKVVVIELPHEEWSDMQMMGNPVRDELALSFGVRRDGVLRLRVIDPMGRLLYEKQRTVSAGENRIAVPTINLIPGGYILETVIGDERRIARFVKE